MLDIKEVLFDENVCLNLNATTKDEVISEMTEMLYRNQVIEDQKTFIKEIYDKIKKITADKVSYYIRF